VFIDHCAYCAGATAEVSFGVTSIAGAHIDWGDWPTLRLNAVLKVLRNGRVFSDSQ
jgi:hypothetical protein